MIIVGINRNDHLLKLDLEVIGFMPGKNTANNECAFGREIKTLLEVRRLDFFT